MDDLDRVIRESVTRAGGILLKLVLAKEPKPPCPPRTPSRP